MIKRIKSLPISIFLTCLSATSFAVSSFAYLPTQDAGSDTSMLSIYTQDESTGTLTPSSAASIYISFYSVATDPKTQHAYALSSDNTVYTYNISTLTNGALTQVGQAVATGEEPEKILFNGNYAYVVSQGRLTNSGSISIYSFDQVSGEISPLSSVNNTVGNPVSMAIDSSGKYAYEIIKGSMTTNQVNIFGINTSGSLNLLENVKLSGSPSGIAADKNGHIYIVTDNMLTGDGVLTSYSVNSTNGRLTPISSSAAGGTYGFAQGVTIAPNGLFAYVGAYNIGNPATPQPGVLIYKINSAGALTADNVMAVGSSGSVTFDLMPPTFDPSGKFAYIVDSFNATYVYNFNATTGALSPQSQIGGTNIPTGAVSFN